MQCILSALKSESEPFIKFYNLEKDSRFSFPVFRNKDLYLLGIGVGKKYIKKIRKYRSKNHFLLPNIK